MALRYHLGRLRSLSWRPQLLHPNPSSLRLQHRPRTAFRTYTSSPGGQDGSRASSRVEKILSRLPPSMRKYTDRLRNAPVSHVVAFLILHELTAIVPLLGLFGLFHYTTYVPIGYMLENYGGYVREGVGRFEKYFKRKGWFGFGSEEDSPIRVADEGETEKEAVLKRWESDGKYKVVVEVALAYAITKALLPVRIIGSVWATPWFAGVLVRIRRLASRK